MLYKLLLFVKIKDINSLWKRDNDINDVSLSSKTVFRDDIIYDNK